MGRSSRIARIPALAWLAAIVIASSLLRLWLVRGMVAPFIFIDELIYSELAKSLAEGGGYAIREVPTSGYSLTYPALVAPAWGLFDDGVTAYNAAKSINAVVMSLAAVPTYFLAVRIARPRLALVAALIAVAVPSMAYTATITTESLFYPVSLGVALALVRYLEVASWPRLGVLLAALALAFATRSQALSFVPAIVTAPLFLALLRGSWRDLRRFAPLYAVLSGAFILLLVLQTARGRALTDLLGAYSIVGEDKYDLSQALQFWLWHAEELTLYAAIVPVIALAMLAIRGRGLEERLQEYVAATVALLVWSTLAVAVFASRFASDRVQDRYLFFLVPLLVVALVAWVHIGAPRPWVAWGVAAIALGATLVFPYSRFIGEPAKSDSIGLIPLWAASAHLLAGSYVATVAVIGAVLVLLFLLVPTRLTLIIPLTVLLAYCAFSRAVWTSHEGFRVAGVGALFQGIRSVPRTWIDGAVEPGAEVVAIWTGTPDRFTVNQSEFFNRSVGRVFYTTAPTPGGVGEVPIEEGRDGMYRDPGGGVVEAAYALVDQTLIPDGEVVARDKALGMTVWRLNGPLQNTLSIDGVYPGDTWSGRVVTWTLRRCRPGTLSARVSSDPNLFAVPQTVKAITHGAESSVRMRPDESRTLAIPVAPDADGTCRVRYEVGPTANPSKVVPGSTDDRELGAHFSISYTADS